MVGGGGGEVWCGCGCGCGCGGEEVREEKRRSRIQSLKG